jgi:hypothetical protein
MHPKDLPDRWREMAEEQREFGAEAQARTLEWSAANLEVAWREWELEELTLQEAAEESGYSEDHLGRLIRDGSIPNAGQPYAPRILRRDLPKKPGRDGQPHPRCVGSKQQIARSVADSWEGESDG